MKKNLHGQLCLIVMILLISLACNSVTATPSPTQTKPLVATKTSPPTEPPLPAETPNAGLGNTYTRPADGMVMVYVPEGKFSMGSNDGIDWDQPVHDVTLDAYWFDQTEVTNGMVALCVQAGACQPPSDLSSYTHPGYYGDSQFADYPVINVSWNDAQAYCAWAGARLPTEAEWEKAALGETGLAYPWGNAYPDCSLANFWGSNGADACVGDMSAVGSYPAGASPYGALDMAGNVLEWVADWGSKTYYGSSPSSNPTGPAAGDERMLRGGAWVTDETVIRSSHRIWLPPDKHYNYVGFRCALASP